MTFTVAPASPDRWADVTAVFGDNGGYGGCWCMFWRLTNQQAAGGSAGDYRQALRELVAAGAEPGLLLYQDGQAVGWVAIGPRPGFARLFRTKDLFADKVVGTAPGDDAADSSIWSAPCVYVSRAHRKGGLSGELIDAAVAYAKSNGAATVESYPVADSRHGSLSGLATGTIGMFARAGFELHRAPISGRRAVMRRAV